MTLASTAVRPLEAAPEMEPCEIADERHSGVVSRALRVLDTFGGVGTVFGVSELARRAALPKSTTFRIVTELVDSGYVRRVGSGYALSHHMFTLSNRHTPDEARRAPRTIAAPHLGGLFLQTGFAVSFGILRGTEVVYVGQVQGPRTPVLPAVLGERLPASATALGKAILGYGTKEQLRTVLDSELPRLTRNSITSPKRLLSEFKTAHESRLAFDHQEARLGLSCVAAPILVPGQPATGVSVCGPTGQIDLEAVGRLVQQTAIAIAVDLVRNATH